MAECKTCKKPVAEGVEQCWNCRDDSLPADLKDKSAKQLADMAAKKPKEGKAPPDFDEPVPGRMVGGTPMAGGRALTPFGTDRDEAIKKFAEMEVGERKSRESADHGKQILPAHCPVKFTKEMKLVACDMIAKTGCKSDGYKAAGVSHATFMRHQREDPEFAEQIEAAIDIHNADLYKDILNWGRRGILVEEFDSKTGQPRQRVMRSERMMELAAKIMMAQLQPRSYQQTNIQVNMPKITINPVKRHDERTMEQVAEVIEVNADETTPDES